MNMNHMQRFRKCGSATVITCTVDAESFARRYTQVSPGIYRKSVEVWVRVVDHSGGIKTREDVTRYDAGDYIVYNDAEGVDGYAVKC